MYYFHIWMHINSFKHYNFLLNLLLFLLFGVDLNCYLWEEIFEHGICAGQCFQHVKKTKSCLGYCRSDSKGHWLLDLQSCWPDLSESFDPRAYYSLPLACTFQNKLQWQTQKITYSFIISPVAKNLPLSTIFSFYPTLRFTS